MEAYQVIDNNVVVSLREFYCDAHKHKPFTEMVDSTCEELTVVFDRLRRFAVGKKLITTTVVQNEFKPERGTLAEYPGFKPDYCNYLKDHIRQELQCLALRDLLSPEVNLLSVVYKLTLRYHFRHPNNDVNLAFSKREDKLNSKGDTKCNPKKPCLLS